MRSRSVLSRCRGLVMPLLSLVLLSGVALTARAQEPAHEIAKKLGPVDIIMPHITDSKHLEVPCIKSWSEWACEVELPRWPVTIGGRTIDFGPTKHVVFLALAALVAIVVLVGTAQSHKRHSNEVGRPRGFAAGIEGVILYLRNEIYVPVLGGHGGEKYVSFPLTLFFFILFCNLFGLIPFGSTPTGNITVTGTLALITFLVVETVGIATLGAGYIKTIIYWPDDMPLGLKIPMTLIMSPMELLGKFIKPFALTLRLFANMIGGHVVLLSMIGLIFMFGLKVAIAPLAMAIAITMLEILVALIQAFIFSLLAAVFIGQMRAAHH